MLSGAKHVLAGFVACAVLAGCSGGAQLSPSAGGSSLASQSNVSSAARTAFADTTGCKPLPSQLYGRGGTYVFRPDSGIAASLGYASNSLGKAAAKGYTNACDQPLGGNTPAVPDGYTLDWEGIVSTDDNLTVTFDPAKRAMRFSGPQLKASTSYTLFVFAADQRLNWNRADTRTLGTPVNGALTTPSLFENGYVLSNYGDFFILAH